MQSNEEGMATDMEGARLIRLTSSLLRQEAVDYDRCARDDDKSDD